MKRPIVIYFLLSVSYLFASPVEIKTAALVARNWHAERNWKSNVFSEISDTLYDIRDNETLWYVFNFTDKGYVMVSADNRIKPIICYALSGSFSKQNHPPALDWLLEKYREQILYIKKNGLPLIDANTDAWLRLSKQIGEFVPDLGITDVGPLLETLWDQGSGWNVYCPVDPLGPGGHAWAGCVATAMAQVLKYWNFPFDISGIPGYNCPNYGWISPIGYTVYPWNAMNNINPSDAAALLTFHCGVSVEMDYGINGNGSGANHPDARNALSDYFNYSATYHEGDLSTSQIITDLNLGKPIIYGGCDNTNPYTGCHSFVIDGYQGTSYFHVNWGWGGDNNGLYTLDYLYCNPYVFSEDNDAIYGILPNVPYNLVLNDPNTSGNYVALNQITLANGFSTQAGGSFHAVVPGKDNSTTKEIELNYEIPASGLVEISVIDVFGNKVRSIYLGNQDNGQNTISWDGRNDNGDLLPLGKYIRIVKCGKYENRIALNLK